MTPTLPSGDRSSSALYLLSQTSRCPSPRSTVPAGLISRYLWTFRSRVHAQQGAAAEEHLALPPGGAFGVARCLGIVLELHAGQPLGQFALRLRGEESSAQEQTKTHNKPSAIHCTFPLMISCQTISR